MSEKKLFPVLDSKSLPGEVLVFDELSGLLTRSNFDLERLFEDIVATTTRIMGLKAGVLRLYDEDSGELTIRAYHGLSDRFLAMAPVFDVKSRFSRLIQNEGILQVLDIEQEPDLYFKEAARQEGIVSLLAVGLAQDDRIIGALSVYTDRPHRFTEREIRTLRVIANYASIALKMTRLHQAQMEAAAVKQELALAASIQAGILPTEMPVFEGLDIAGHMIPWEKIGGDFYDFIELPRCNLGIAVGDVSGKGIPAALLMFAVRMALRAHVEHEYTAREIIRRVSRAVYRDTKAGQFATLFYGILDVPKRVLTFVNAGHPPPIVLRGHEVITLETGGVPVGLFPDTGYQEEASHVQPGDVVVLYTDGYTDVTNAAGEVFGVDRFTACLQRHREASPARIVQEVDRAVAAFLKEGAMGDDRTLVVLKIGA